MEINYKNTQVTIKQTFRAMLIFEQMEGHTFSGKSLEEMILYFYILLCTSMKDYSIQYDDFLEWLDENPEQLGLFTQWLLEEVQNTNNLYPVEKKETAEGDDEEESKKK